MAMDKLSIHQRLTLILLCASFSIKGSLAAAVQYNIPARSPSMYHQLADSEAVTRFARRESSPFQLCLQCQCCAAGNTSNCKLMPCCFSIDCNLPNKPYGVCAFVPKSCNCAFCT